MSDRSTSLPGAPLPGRPVPSTAQVAVVAPAHGLVARVGVLAASPLARQLLAFLAVGGVGFVVDVALFNALRATVLDPAVVPGGALWAKAISTSVAILLNWIGNRTLAFRDRHTTGRARRAVAGEAARFLAASLLGASVSLLCLLVSHVVLGLDTALADNISANVIGLALGTALRFVLYRAWVFARRAA